MAVSKNTHPPTPRANPPKKTHSQPDIEPDMPDLPAYHLPSSSVNFTEAIGKTVALIYYAKDTPEWQWLEVCFTDGTVFTFDLRPRVHVHANYTELRHGDVEIIRNYGIVRVSTPGDGDG